MFSRVVDNEINLIKYNKLKMDTNTVIPLSAIRRRTFWIKKIQNLNGNFCEDSDAKEEALTFLAEDHKRTQN
jgi:hypothetical protein